MSRFHRIVMVAYSVIHWGLTIYGILQPCNRGVEMPLLAGSALLWLLFLKLLELEYNWETKYTKEEHK